MSKHLSMLWIVNYVVWLGVVMSASLFIVGWQQWVLTASFLGYNLGYLIIAKRGRRILKRLPHAIQMGLYAVNEQKRVEVEQRKELEEAERRGAIEAASTWAKKEAAAQHDMLMDMAAWRMEVREAERKQAEAAKKKRENEIAKEWGIFEEQVQHAPRKIHNDEYMRTLLITQEEWVKLAKLAKEWKAMAGSCPLGTHRWAYLRIPPIKNAVLCSCCGAIGESPEERDYKDLIGHEWR